VKEKDNLKKNTSTNKLWM